jgi:circadian clock protein KaiC
MSAKIISPKKIIRHRLSNRISPVTNAQKALTGIAGLDEVTGGGFPRGKTTLIEGGPGSGKTILALQTLVNGATLFNEPGIFVAFEESSKNLIANAGKFGWDLPALQRKKLFFLDAQPNPDVIQSGGFDLTGMLAALGAKAEEINAKRIVFDALDMVLTLLNDPLAERREIFRLHEWLSARNLTGLITCKRTDEGITLPFGFMQFMVDCAVLLRHEVVQSVSQRNLRVVKYRGSAFEENEAPYIISDSGLEVASTWQLGRTVAQVSSRRISSGVKRLDTVLGGGYYQGSSVLVTGVPGTAKTTLSGAFAEAACERGERALFVSFDTDSAQVIRNLSSVHINLARHVKSGLLHVVSARSTSASAEIHLMNIKNIAQAHRAKCVVVDSLSAMVKMGISQAAHGVSERLLDWAKANELTLLCTSLLDATAPKVESISLPISTIADTWIHLSYLSHAGERNRSLSVVKSRGSWHSNQVRELVLSSHGVTLTDAYTAGGEVLMGTLRWEKERAIELARVESNVLALQKQARLEVEEAQLEAQLKALHRDLVVKRMERVSLSRSKAASKKMGQHDRSRLRVLRGADELEGNQP